MTNYEKNKELLDMYTVAAVTWGVNEDGEILNCRNNYFKNCPDCIFRKKSCAEARLKWLQQEYKEPEVDWSKVEVDTPIFVKASEDFDWMKRYFAGYIGGKVCAFNNGRTSEDFIAITPWDYAKLAESEDVLEDE